MLAFGLRGDVRVGRDGVRERNQTPSSELLDPHMTQGACFVVVSLYKYILTSKYHPVVARGVDRDVSSQHTFCIFL